MGIMDLLGKKKEESKETKTADGKFSNPCAACGGAGTEKKWMGQYWHKKCMRASKKMARKMV